MAGVDRQERIEKITFISYNIFMKSEILKIALWLEQPDNHGWYSAYDPKTDLYYDTHATKRVEFVEGLSIPAEFGPYKPKIIAHKEKILIFRK